MALPLDGLRVLDVSRLLPGGYASQMLADLGADVLKIEEPGSGDYSRVSPPFARTVGHAFRAVNRNKRSAALNLKHPGGREALLRLVDGADVLLESFRPGVMARLGLAHADLLARNPRLIVCAITGYGQTGPASQRAGHDLNYLALAGLLAHLQRPGQPPTVPGVQLADIAGGGLMAVVGVLAALVGRAASGRGRIVDVSMLEGTLALAPLLASMLLSGEPEPAPGGNWLAGAQPCYDVYETSDGRYVALAALEQKFWQTFCERVGRPDLAAAYLPTTAAARAALADDLRALFRTRTRDEWATELAEADVCLTPVYTMAEALADPQVRARGLVASGDLGPEGVAEVLRLAPLLSEAPQTVRRGLPALGEHTAEALAAVGYSAQELADLAAAGAIALP